MAWVEVPLKLPLSSSKSEEEGNHAFADLILSPFTQPGTQTRKTFRADAGDEKKSKACEKLSITWNLSSKEHHLRPQGTSIFVLSTGNRPTFPFRQLSAWELLSHLLAGASGDQRHSGGPPRDSYSCFHYRDDEWPHGQWRPFRGQAFACTKSTISTPDGPLPHGSARSSEAAWLF